MSPKAEEVINLIPEIRMIKDDQLRGNVASVWADAIELGGWKVQDLDSIPFTLLIPDCKFSLLHHTRAVTRTAVSIADFRYGITDIRFGNEKYADRFQEKNPKSSMVIDRLA